MNQQRPKRPQEHPKRELRRLESLLSGLRATTDGTKDPKGGCFCRARVHDLSPYAPICKSCGLVLCSVNLPHFACPHCATPLLSLPAREALVLRLQDQIGAARAREEADRLHAREEARRAAGAFPPLAASASDPRASTQTPKVLSINSKTKKVTVSSYSPSPAQSRSSTPKVVEEEEPERAPPPRPGVAYAKGRPDPGRPWMNLREPAPLYVPSKQTPGRKNRRE